MGSRTQGGHTLQYGHPPYFSSNYNYTNLNPDHNLKLWQRFELNLLGDPFFFAFLSGSYNPSNPSLTTGLYYSVASILVAAA